MKEYLSAERAKLHLLSRSAHPQLLSQMTHLGFELSASRGEITKCESSHLRTAPLIDTIFPFLSRLKKYLRPSPKLTSTLSSFIFFPKSQLLLQGNLWTTPKVVPPSHLKSKQKSLTCSSNAATLSPSPCCFSSFSLAAASFLRKKLFPSLLCENNQISTCNALPRPPAWPSTPAPPPRASPPSPPRPASPPPTTAPLCL